MIIDEDELEKAKHKGRIIANDHSLDEFGKHCSLWLSLDIYDVLKKLMVNLI